MTETERSYNGWRNYETWNVKLWLDNDQGSYDYWNEVADEILAEHTTETATDETRSNGDEPEKQFDSDSARSDLADRLKNEVNEQAPDLGASCYTDLLNAALGEVDWYEIAESMIDDAIERAKE